MKRKGAAAAIAAALLLLAGCTDTGSPSDGESYPTRDITLIVPFATGGSTDPAAREYAQRLEAALGATVIVRNREGAGGTIGTGEVVTANPDGYTIGITTQSQLANQPIRNRDLPYDTTDDYEVIVKLYSTPLLLAVRADAPWQTFEEFIAAARQDPGAIRVGIGAAGGTPDLAMQTLNLKANVEFTIAPFSGGAGEAQAAVLGGHIEAIASHPSTIQGQVASGGLRTLASFSTDPIAAFPEATPLPSIGYDVVAAAEFYIIAPKGTPPAVLQRLREVSRQIVTSAEFEAFATGAGNVTDPKTPEEIVAEINSYRAVYEALAAQQS